MANAVAAATVGFLYWSEADGQERAVTVGAWPAMEKFGWSFLWTRKWSATKQQFGAAAFIYGTLVSSLIALVIALPISLGSALFLTKLAPKFRLRIPRVIAASGQLSP